MIARLHRSGGMQPPPDDELVEVSDDGSYVVWRSVGWATRPVSPVGLFAGQLDGDSLAALKRQAASAAAAGPLRDVPMPGSPIICVTVGEVSADVAAGRSPGGPWGTLLARLESLLALEGAKPVAAIRLRVEGEKAVLKHLGTKPLKLDLRRLTIRADRLDEGEAVDETEPVELDLGEVEAAPGWQSSVPLNHGWDLGEAERVSAFARFAVYRASGRVEVSLQSV